MSSRLPSFISTRFAPRLSAAFATTAALAGLLLFSGCGPKNPSSSSASDASGSPGSAATAPIKIGNLASTTGKDATYGQSSTRATRLAIDEINAAGGVLGRPIELIFEDTQSKPGESALVVKKLITRDHVVALIGEIISSRSLEAASVAQSLKIPLLTPSATNPAVTATGDYIFRACFIDPFQGKILATFAREDLGSKRAAILTSTSSSYSTGLAHVFREHYPLDGGEIVADLKFSEGDKDFKAQLTTIRAAKPDVLFVPAYYTEAALIAKQARELGITIPLLGGDGWEAPELFEIAGDAVNGCYYSTHFSAGSTDPKIMDFVARYRARYDGAVPDCMAALGYDAAYLMVDAIRRAGSTEPDKIKAALATTKGFIGVTGRIDMDKDRNASKPATLLKIENRAYTYIKTIAP